MLQNQVTDKKLSFTACVNECTFLALLHVVQLLSFVP